jgi:two-component sensor histidine kinase
MKWIIRCSLLLLFSRASAQLPILDSTAEGLKSTPVLRSIHTYDKRSQRLLLELGFTFFNAARENQIGLDSALMHASRYQGLPRMLVVGEAFPETLSADWFEARNPAKGMQLLKAAEGPGRIPLLVLLGAYYVFEYNGFDRYRDSVLYFLNEAIIESQRMHGEAWAMQAQCLMMKMYAEAGASKSADSCFDLLVRSCQQAKDKPMEAKAWKWRGVYTAFSPQTTNNRIGYFENAAKLYRSIGDRQNLIIVQQDIGYLYLASMQLQKADALLTQTKALEDSIGFPFTYYTLHGMSFAESYMGQFAVPLDEIVTAVRIAQASGDSLCWPYLYTTVGADYSKVERYQYVAINWFLLALNRFIQTGGDPSMYGTLCDVATELTKVNRAQEALKDLQRIALRYPPISVADQRNYHIALLICYAKLKAYTEANEEVRIIDQLIANPKMDLRSFSIGQYYTWKGDLLFEENRLDSCRYYLNLALKQSSSFALSDQNYFTLHSDLFYLDSLQGHYADAIRHLQAAEKITRDEFSRQSEREQEELNMQYETAKKEKELLHQHQQIAGLEQQDKLRSANLRQANLIRNITIGAIMLLLLIGALLYRQYRQRQKNARLILQKNKLLEHLLTEKEWLIKEIHHRVKNNLHTVICLLESQAKHLENDALKAIEVSQNRIYAMSLLHQKIYQSADVRTIDMATYIPEFVGYLYESFGSPSPIRFDLDIDTLRMDIAQAIPVALIINEAVTNCLKYAFPEEQPGLICVGLHEREDAVRLIVSDNGIGIGVIPEASETGSLGLELMEGLTQELRGNMSIEVQGGTLITIVIPNQIFDQPDLGVVQDQTVLSNER